jgi:cleavage stimulation factor subunit 3
MELAIDNFYGAEQIFGKSLLTVPNVALWTVYLNYIRRRNDLTNDTSGTARATISQAYDFVLANIGIDRESGKIWKDYIDFIKSAPGNVGGANWQDQQKMDQLRKAYQRAVCMPIPNVGAIWKEYDQFEMSVNKVTGRKFLQEKSPSYMTARSANTSFENVTRGLIRTNLPRLPPALGFEGDQEYLQQTKLWQEWIKWEIEDPLVLKDEDLEAYKQRILYAYKQAVMALRFWPEMWVEAADWCFTNGLEKDGSNFLSQGVAANPESCVLAFKQADRLESSLPVEEGEEGIASRGAAVRAPYNKLLDALYDMMKKIKAREATEVARIEEQAKLDAQADSGSDEGEDDDDETNSQPKEDKAAAREKQIKLVKDGYEAQWKLVQRTMSHVWIALMRAMRRVQGKGKVGAVVGGSRQILNDARLRGKITSDVYVASALIEHNVYKDPAGTKIFERGAKLFPEDENFILEYLKHLLAVGDTTNARAVFETSVNRLAQKPDTVDKAKQLYIFFHKYEAEYGELAQISRLEARMAELYPQDPTLQRFAARYASRTFDPTAVRPIISPATQMRPKAPTIIESIEDSSYPQLQTRDVSPRPNYAQASMARQVSPRPTTQYLQPQPHAADSPKRAYDASFPESSADGPPRKLQRNERGESPLKGAAGRRLDQAKRGTGAAPFTIPRDVTFLLSIIPRAETYQSTLFSPEGMVRLLAGVRIPEYGEWKAAREGGQQGQGGGQRYY